MGKFDDLKAIMGRCEKKFNHGPAHSWKHSDFNRLSREVFNKTGVHISPNTLKRVFGKIAVEDGYLPQQATFDALRHYCDDMEGAAVAEQPDALPVTDIPETETTGAGDLFHGMRGKWLTGFTILGIVLIAATVFWKSVTRQKAEGRIELTGIEGAVPATAHFDLLVPHTGDTVFVYFGDKSAPVAVTERDKKTAHNYLFPGIFEVTVRSKSGIIASTKICIRSKGWIGMAYHRQRDLPNDYYEFPATRQGPDSLFHVPNIVLRKAGLDTLQSFYLRFANFSNIEKCTDDFIFEAVFKNDLDSQRMYCSGSQFQISGMDNDIRFKFVSPGCSLWVLNLVSEQRYEGRSKDLSNFVLDLDHWNSVKLINQNKHLTLYVNQKLLFTGSYKESLGDIKGLFWEFEGNGFIKSCSLKTLEGKLLYHF